MTGYVLPDAVSLVRLITQQCIAARKAKVTLSLELGTPREMARRVNDPSSYDLLQVTLTDEPTAEDVSFTLGGAAYGGA